MMTWFFHIGKTIEIHTRTPWQINTSIKTDHPFFERIDPQVVLLHFTILNQTFLSFR